MKSTTGQAYRAVKAQDTYERIRPLFGKLGVTRLANITGLDEVGIPVYVAMRPNSRSVSLSQGKGITAINAKVSAAMETIECFHGETIDHELVSGSIADLAQAHVICNAAALPAYKDSKLAPDEPMPWVAGIDVANERSALVPYDCVHNDFRPQSPKRHFVQTTNGLASGNTDLEAMAHGLCEVIERDAYSCWTLQPAASRAQTKIRLETITSPDCSFLIEKICVKAHLGVWDVSSDLGIPAFLARVISLDGPPRCAIRPASGFGCHPDKDLALIRALTEAAQSRLTFIAGARDDIRLAHYRTHTSPDEYQRWHRSIYEEPAIRDFDRIPSHDVENTQDIYATLMAALAQKTLSEVHAVKLTKAQFGLPVFKMIVPGLEGGESYSGMSYGPRAQEILERGRDRD